MLTSISHELHDTVHYLALAAEDYTNKKCRIKLSFQVPIVETDFHGNFVDQREKYLRYNVEKLIMFCPVASSAPKVRGGTATFFC